jgi:hypothetical protein
MQSRKHHDSNITLEVKRYIQKKHVQIMASFIDEHPVLLLSEVCPAIRCDFCIPLNINNKKRGHPMTMEDIPNPRLAFLFLGMIP